MVLSELLSSSIAHDRICLKKFMTVLRLIVRI